MKSKRLQVYNEVYKIWEWVFCYDRWGNVITTDNYKKALPKEDLDYFVTHFGHLQFRIY